MERWWSQNRGVLFGVWPLIFIAWPTDIHDKLIDDTETMLVNIFISKEMYDNFTIICS
jgi:hypothetical protein